jgi:predicted Zn-dependent peptidase
MITVKTLAVLAACVLLCVGAPVAAAELQLPKDLPPYAADKPVPVPKIDQHTLANGMTVWIIADAEGAPKANFVFAVRGGSAHEPRAMNGLSSILASTIEEGTKSRSAIQIAQELQALGASLGAGAGEEGTTVSASGLSANAGRILALLADVARHPTFPDAEVDLAKMNALHGLKAARAQPDYQAGVEFDKAVFGDHPYGTGELTEASIMAVTPQVLRELHAKRFRPDRALLVVTGRIDAGAILRVTQEAFGDWKAAGSPEAEIPAAPTVTPRKLVFVPRANSVQSAIRLGRPAFPARDPLIYKADVAESILGGGVGGRLFQNLREDKGYTYGAYASFGAERNGGSFGAEADVRNDVTGAAITEFNKELQRLIDEPVGAAELERSRRYLAGVYLFRNQLRGAVASSLAGLWIDGRAPEDLGQYTERVKAVTAADVQDVARRYFNPQDQSLVVVGDPSVAEQLKAFGEFRSVTAPP